MIATSRNIIQVRKRQTEHPSIWPVLDHSSEFFTSARHCPTPPQSSHTAHSDSSSEIKAGLKQGGSLQT
jgi:hypothetical protein